MPHPRKTSKIRNFFKNHRVESIVVGVFALLVILTIVGMAKVEPYQRTTFFATLPSQLLMGFFQALIFAGIYAYLLRGAGLPFTGSRVKADQVNVPLSSVIGLKYVKQEVMEVINFLQDHQRLQSLGGRMINGILFTGDPGTGKTLLAKAVATECGLPFIGISGASFVEIYVGVGASRVRDLFKRAGELADEFGGCVIFIDEFDALAKTREYTPY
jgi:cell division protease FtsH